MNNSEIKQKADKYTEQREREAFDAGRKTIALRASEYFAGKCNLKYKTFNDYLKSKNRGQALSELVSDGEKNGEYESREARK